MAQSSRGFAERLAFVAERKLLVYVRPEPYSFIARVTYSRLP
jgi:hypothetical protein